MTAAGTAWEDPRGLLAGLPDGRMTGAGFPATVEELPQHPGEP